MKTNHQYIIFFQVLLISLILLSGCRKDEMLVIDKVTGLVQKGPFINGTSVTIYELDGSLVQSGNSYNTQINNNSGSFEIDNMSLRSGFIQLVANGYYYDEVKGSLSAAPLTLYALSDVTDRKMSVNVNLLTHLEKERIEYLSQEMKFAQAKKTAQSEILSIFGIISEGMNRSETMDIMSGDESAGMLLAISVILQGSRTAADLTEFLANISDDIREDGSLNDENTRTELRKTALSLNPVNIGNKLRSRYQELGISSELPDFEKYINQYLAFTGSKPIAISRQAEFNLSGITLRGIVNANDLPTTVTFEYGTGTAYEKTVAANPASISGHLNTVVSAVITDLVPGSQYHFRIKATNSLGTTYSSGMPLVKADPVSDIEGNLYNTVIIGSQVWISENLRVTKYNDGTQIPEISDPAAWQSTSTGAYCNYMNDPEKVKSYGRIYNSWAVNDTRKLCPAGWHVPSNQEWMLLANFLVENGYGFMGNGPAIAKSLSATTGWMNNPAGGTPGNDQESNNISGFSGVPAGARMFDGNFFSAGYIASWHTYNSGQLDLTRILSNTQIYFQQLNYKKPLGASVRCVKD